MNIERFIEGLPVGIIILNSDVSIQMGNETAFRLLEISVEDLLINKFDSIVKNQKIKDALHQIRTGSAVRQDIFIDHNGKYIKCSINGLHDGSGEENKIMIVLEDFTNHKQLDNIKQEFIQTILHRIRNPLSTLKTTLSLLSSNKISTVPQEIKELLDMSAHEANRLNVILNDLRTLFVLETGLAEKELDIESFTIEEITDRAIGEFLKTHANSEEIRKRFVLKGDRDAIIKADFEKLKQVLIAIINNAYIFSTGRTPIEINAHKNNGQTTIEIKDYGIGISEEDKKSVFTKYFREDNTITRNNEGSGLGLFIARNLIELMKGTIYFESTIDKGCSFFVSLPSECGKPMLL